MLKEWLSWLSPMGSLPFQFLPSLTNSRAFSCHMPFVCSEQNSPCTIIRKGPMQRLKFIKASEILVCQAQEETQTTGWPFKPLSISFLLFFPLYRPMLISCLSYEEMCFKNMLEIDVQINSMNISMLLLDIPFMHFYHFTEISVVWALRN